MAATGAAHVVQFYEDDRFLCDVVAHFIATGLQAGEVAIVIAEESRREALRTELDARGIEVTHAEQSGSLHMLDARSTLARFMVGDRPEEHAFSNTIGDVLARARAARP